MAKRYMSELVLKKSVTILVKNSFYKKEEIINFASEICNFKVGNVGTLQRCCLNKKLNLRLLFWP